VTAPNVEILGDALAARPFLGAAKLLSTGEGNAETDEATNLLRPWGCFSSPFNRHAVDEDFASKRGSLKIGLNKHITRSET
jgi:hypothetical protein